MNYYMSIESKETTLIIKIPKVDTTTIFNISSMVINQISNTNDINISLQNLKNEIMKEYNFNIEIGKLVSKIILD